MKGRGSVLIVEDEPDMRFILQGLLGTEGFETCTVTDGSAAITLARQQPFDVAIVDLLMPGLSGFETVRQLKNLSCGTEIIILTGNPSLDTAIGAVREYVFESLLKPPDMARLKDVVRDGVRKARQNNNQREAGGRITVENSRWTRGERAARPLFPKNEPNSFLVGSSAAISRIRTLIAEVGPTDLTVLIRGETGTGKEVVARSIHACSGRDVHGLFTKINCPAIPDDLFESEMFGHEKGAFTGAVTQRVGRFELGTGGTVLLDEIGAISMRSQSKLLEAIEHKEFTRLGGRHKIAIDVRILAVTSAPLEAMIDKEQFRPDLLYRLQQFSIVVPPLRDHREDIPELAHHFNRKYSTKFAKEVPELSSDLMTRLCECDWPGNVRQLDAIIAQYYVTGDLEIIERELPSPLSLAPGYCAANSLQKHEISAIRSALNQTRGNQRRAASLLGLSYSALRRRVAKYRLEVQ
jgi:DNA-binding NtrC family response regulator